MPGFDRHSPEQHGSVGAVTPHWAPIGLHVADGEGDAEDVLLDELDELLADERDGVLDGVDEDDDPTELDRLDGLTLLE